MEDSTRIKSADVALHMGAQYLTLTAKAFIQHENDDSHTNMAWNAERQKLEGRWFNTPSNEFRLVLSATDYELIWEDRNRSVVDRMALSASRKEDVMNWWKTTAETIGGKSVEDVSLHYELPDSEVYQYEAFPTPTSDELGAWMKWRTQGEKWLRKLKGLYTNDIELRIWPHHFDSGMQGKVSSNLNMGVGLAIADQMVDEPYIYLYGSRDGKFLKISSSDPQIGSWIIPDGDGWSGFALRASERDSHLDDEIETVIHDVAQTILRS